MAVSTTAQGMIAGLCRVEPAQELEYSLSRIRSCLGCLPASLADSRLRRLNQFLKRSLKNAATFSMIGLRSANKSSCCFNSTCSWTSSAV